MSPPPSATSKVDELSYAYLDAIDLYQTQRSQLTTDLTRGFMSLAHANVVAPPAGGRYGREQFEVDGRVVTATRGLQISGGEETEAMWECVELPEREERVAKEEPGGGEEGLRRRKPAPTASADTPAESTTPEQRPKPKDPVRLFHALPPVSLRASGAEFSLTLPSICALATTLHKLGCLAEQISHHLRVKSVYKILASPPSWPLGESQLDRDSGFVHLCTAEQTVGVLCRFMGGVERVWVLKLAYKGIAEKMKWEGTEGALGEEFPHLYGTVEEGMVEGVAELERGDGWENIDLGHVRWRR